MIAISSSLPTFIRNRLGGGPYCYLADSEINFVQVRNVEDEPFEMPAKVYLGTLSDCYEDRAIPVPDYQHGLASYRSILTQEATSSSVGSQWDFNAPQPGKT